MTLLSKSTLGLTAATLIATTAQAGGITEKTAQTDQIQPSPVTVQTIDSDGQVGQLTIYTTDSDFQKTAVLGALAQQTTDAYIVQDNDGDLFINHLVPVEDLPDPNLEVRTIDTYTTEYRGMTFTNKIVED